MNHALKLERWLGQAPGPHGIGQVAIRPTGSGYALRHADDREIPDGELHAVDGLAGLRQIVRTDAAGAFRPLRGAPTLRRGWRMEGLSPGALLEALNLVYPGAVAFWAEALEKTLAVAEFPETAGRQTGMYRLTQVATPEQLSEAVRRVCETGCLRRRLWRQVFPGAADAPNVLPLLCPEACNYFIAQARERIVADRATPAP